ncbi:radical SAM family heme chaperone HemW [Pelotalea chapellei]|uniref:Heme chaperone HemW n=1 Tax=Pelotalea chapellei TaxID=44671 RepID=A0ABS5U687_9BACT|nr:radical SAM family heme chaperone HemW [Pelotalea chapellei]MBT1071164.1 radical SAM family heme chaperone HemW [Pelotalea chapellei]
MFTRLYLHIPFCQRKCDYCSFVSMQANQHSIEDYVVTLLEEMRLVRATYGAGDGIDSIYFGGGTPSQLSPHQIARLLEQSSLLFKWKARPEITLEANPGTVDAQRLADFHAAGINRLSLGVQSFDNQLLSRLGRIHTEQQVVNTVSAARMAGFDNLGIDLIHSLPGQTLDMWRSDLARALQCETDHISIYGLTIEEGTPFALRYTEESPLLADEDLSAAMFETADTLLTAAGYEHYEIANYARHGFRSRHNSGYWKRDGYLGLGIAAHSLLRDETCDVRFSTTSDLDEYTTAINGGILPHHDTISLSREEAMAEFMYLGLRLKEGIEFREFESNFGCSPLKIYAATFDLLSRAGLLTVDKTSIKLTLRGMLLSNQVFSRFLP